MILGKLSISQTKQQQSHKNKKEIFRNEGKGENGGGRLERVIIIRMHIIHVWFCQRASSIKIVKSILQFLLYL